MAGKADSGSRDGKAGRRDRLAEALRANLQRRKAQARQRDKAGPGKAGDKPKGDAGKG